MPVGRLVVAQDSSTPFPTISAALDSARNGDTVFVMPGEYHEVVKLLKLQHITLLGADPATTVVDAEGAYAAIELRTDSNRVSGFTVRGADSHGIWVRDGQQFIDHCLIIGNSDRGIYLSSFAGHAFAKLTNARAQFFTDLADATHAKDDDHNHQHNQQFGCANSTHVDILPGSALFNNDIIAHRCQLGKD